MNTQAIKSLLPHKRFKLNQFLSLKTLAQYAENLKPLLIFLTLLLFLFGVIQGFFLTPPDHQQGEGFKIIYVHVPSAFWSLAIYCFIFVNSVIFLIWRIKVADSLAACSASVGTTFTLIALVTGSLWGKPMWGTWWVWDARLTSELILLFLYLGYMGLRSATVGKKNQSKLAAILAILGMVDVPIVHFSVQWWHTLHQGATLSRFAKPLIATEMLIPLLVMIIAFGAFYLVILSYSLRTEMLRREIQPRTHS